MRHLERSTAGPWGGVQTVPPKTTAFLSDTKVPFWWDGERREQDENKPQQNSTALSRVGSLPPLWSPTAAAGRPQGVSRSTGAEIGKVPKPNRESFLFISSLK